MTETTDRIRRACDIAAGRAAADPSAPGKRIRAAHKNLNCKGRGDHWFRMVLRGSRWSYFSEERLPAGSFLAADRRCTVYGEVFSGELVCQHDKAKGVDAVWLACEPESSSALEECTFRKRRDGRLAVTLPDGTEVVVDNPHGR